MTLRMKELLVNSSTQSVFSTLCGTNLRYTLAFVWGTASIKLWSNSFDNDKGYTALGTEGKMLMFLDKEDGHGGSHYIHTDINKIYANIRSDARRLLQMMESNCQDESYGLSSLFSIAPMESSLPPLPLHDQNTPPFCVYPPFMLPPPPTTTTIIPPPPPSTPLPPYQLPPSPPKQQVPRPPLVFQPPVVHPPPSAPPPPPPHKGEPECAVWCVAKAHVPNPIIQEALDYACGSGADCDPIKLNGSCFLPNTLIAHASFAFNSYWQRTKVAGGTCDFGGTAMLVTVDPSYDGCHFIYN